ncbi:ADAMTS-like protein 1 [Sycon ciliatum]|uniref:ADAMTS-like protein 1 n=1 Tax=Sycon ciliatum TaxID=27933 RepID=UPI0031F70539
MLCTCLVIVVLAQFISPSAQAEVHWRAQGWGHEICSRTCGGGVLTRGVRCASSSPPHMTVADSRCNASIRPQSSRPCNTHDCRPRIYRNNWSTCRDCCRSRRLQCRVRQNGGYIRIVPAALCGLESDVQVEVCRYGHGCMVSWQPYSFPCCHPQARQGYACLDSNNKLMPDWVCFKLQRVGGFTLPTRHEQCNADATCREDFSGAFDTIVREKALARFSDSGAATDVVATLISDTTMTANCI